MNKFIKPKSKSINNKNYKIKILKNCKIYNNTIVIN